MLFKPVTLINLPELLLLHVKDSQTSYLFLPQKTNMPFGHKRVICEMMAGSGLKLPEQNQSSSRSAPFKCWKCSQEKFQINLDEMCGAPVLPVVF